MRYTNRRSYLLPLFHISSNARAHAFATSRVDYCNAVNAGAPKTITDKLQRVLNAAARVVSDTKKYDRDLLTLLHDELHRLDVSDVSERVAYNVPLFARSSTSLPH